MGVGYIVVLAIITMAEKVHNTYFFAWSAGHNYNG
jgi:hypothetical protein